MRTIGIEFCDEGFVAVEAAESKFHYIELESSSTGSPGFVYYDGERYICGRQAQIRSRVYPRYVTDQCWDQLSLRLSDLNVPGKAPRYSELAYRHLRMIWKHIQAGGPVGKVVFALPGNYLAGEDGDDEKIGLILGLTQDLNIPLAGIVDMACASLAAEIKPLGIGAGASTAFHIDVHARSTFFSILQLKPLLRSVRLATAPIGFHHIFAELNPKLANSFLSQTAFDVTHEAKTEQLFYNQTQNLLEWFKDREEATIEMESFKRSRKMSVYRDMAAKYLEPVTESLAQIMGKVVKESWTAEEIKSIPFIFSERAAKIPGLAEKIASAIDCSITVTEFGSAARGAALIGKTASVFKNLEEASITSAIDLDQLGLAPASEKMNREPSDDNITVPSSKKNNEAGGEMAPTHVVCGGIGRRISQSGFNLGETFENCPEGFSLTRHSDGRVQLDNSTNGVLLLNGQPAANGEFLKPGDLLTLALGLEDGTSTAQWLLIHCAG